MKNKEKRRRSHFKEYILNFKGIGKSSYSSVLKTRYYIAKRKKDTITYKEKHSYYDQDITIRVEKIEEEKRKAQYPKNYRPIRSKNKSNKRKNRRIK